MINLTFKEAKEYAESGKYRSIPLCTEIFSDTRTPLTVLKILQKASSHCYMLESAEDKQKWGRYTFLGYDPISEITCVNGFVKITKNGRTQSFGDEHPDNIIKRVLKDHLSPSFPYLPPFAGGLVGYFSYDYVKYSEPKLNLDAKDAEGFNDIDLMLFDKVIAFDNYRQKIILICNIPLDNIEETYYDGEETLKAMKNLILNGSPVGHERGKLKSDFRCLFDKEQYCEMVEKAKNYITEGDIFQVVLSNRLDADYEGSLLDAYRVFRTSNPSPYMFYFSGDDIEIAGASPETLVKLQNGILHTFPLAGTRPRGKTEEDKALEADLLSDEKEKAEHNMLVDLGRNDLGRISRFGSVKVEKYMSIERFSHVMHIGSSVRGEIRDDKSAVDAVNAVLPAGTLSGAPKIRACEIINELENNKRGIYGGALGYLDFAGNMDVCIAIRIAFKKNGRVFVRSGAGIVADSVPEKEYEECINKAMAVVKALEAADKGIE